MRTGNRLSWTGLIVVIAASLFTPHSGGATALPSQAARATVLRYHWVAGQHYSQQFAQTATTTTKVTPANSGNGTTVQSTRFTATTVVTNVYSDGSAAVRITFSHFTTTSDGHTTPYTVSHYTVFTNLSNTGDVLTTSASGGDSVPSDLAAMLGSTPLWPRPQMPVEVGGSWSGAELVIPGFGKMPTHFQVLALGSKGGRPTVTFRVSITIPEEVSTNDLVVAGPFTLSGTVTAFVDTGAVADAATLRIAFQGQASGVVNGVKIAGTIVSSAVETISPRS